MSLELPGTPRDWHLQNEATEKRAKEGERDAARRHLFEPLDSTDKPIPYTFF